MNHSTITHQQNIKYYFEKNGIFNFLQSTN